MDAYLDFEKPIANLEKRLNDLKDLARQEGVDFAGEIKLLEKKVAQLIDETYSKLTPWQRVQLSRHPNRPHTSDYVEMLFPDFMELHGDRSFGDDPAVLGGVAHWPPALPAHSAKKKDENPAEPFPVLLLGHRKGRSTKQRMERNFGMARPEGYRKAMRLMDLAERSRMPIITFIDTPGAYPGLDAEERGQSQAIAESIHRMFELSVPSIAIVIGEGGSGGALAIGVTNRVLMQEYSTYSVISPESCASILWSDSSLAERASEKLKMSPTELLKLKVIDEIIPEPQGGAHRNWKHSAELIGKSLLREMSSLLEPSSRKLREERLAKFRQMGRSALGHAPSAREER